MTIIARVHNHSIALPADLPVAEGAEVQVTVPEPPVKAGENALAWMEEFVGCLKDLPEDFAAEHDHYIHGTPKRDGR